MSEYIPWGLCLWCETPLGAVPHQRGTGLCRECHKPMSKDRRAFFTQAVLRWRRWKRTQFRAVLFSTPPGPWQICILRLSMLVGTSGTDNGIGLAPHLDLSNEVLRKTFLECAPLPPHAKEKLADNALSWLLEWEDIEDEGPVTDDGIDE